MITATLGVSVVVWHDQLAETLLELQTLDVWLYLLYLYRPSSSALLLGIQPSCCKGDEEVGCTGIDMWARVTRYLPEATILT